MAAVAHGIACGLIVIDGSQAMLGALEQHGLLQRVGRVASTAASRTRRGGSSAGRFARKRDGQELAFTRRVVDKARVLFADAGALILGGKADMKRKLLREMPMALRSVVKTVVPYAGESDDAGLRALARHWQDVQHQMQVYDVATCLRKFLLLAERSADASYCYGDAQTKLALRMGAVDCLLLGRDGAAQP